ncbi:PA14 domain-containing protein [Hymenobacter busanensis]|uniref:PA14 domain-containing protein n=1 Tax=Hymenobacter busanensis TaxID=2607656 RepID=UPI001366D367|nr:PA14 domain-containing protein [Hymenobacter busanensis]QHJ09371.1 hypothetical protein GUY19_19620 [Hymenobacter busanensis]
MAAFSEASKARPIVPWQGAGSGLTASYYTNGTLAGAPALRRVDAAIDFNWGKGAPAAGLPDDNFSVRWEGLLAAPSTGSYRFIAQSGDEVRLWINGKKVLDTWEASRGSFRAASSVGLAAGEKATIKIEYTDAEGDAQIQLMWVGPGQAAQLIPTAYLYPLGSPTTPDPAGVSMPVAATPAPTTPAAAAPVQAAPAAPAPVAPAEKPEPKVAKAAASVSKAETKVAKAETKAENKIEKAESKVEKAETKADKASAKVVEAEAKSVKATTANAPAVVAPGVYVLTSRTTRKPLEVIDPSRPNSRAYQQAVAGTVAVDGGRSSAPQWRIESLGNGYYRLLVPGNNKVLEVLGSSTSNGANLNLWTYYSGNNQLWRIEPTEHGYYKLLAKHSNKALTAKDSIEGGLQQWRYSGKENQMWTLQAVQAEEERMPVGMPGRPGIGANNMSIYPNPSNGIVQLAYTLPAEIPMGWVLYDQRGAAVRVSDYRRRPAGNHHQTLDFTGLPAGDYNLRLTVGATTTRQQLQLRSSSAQGVPATSNGN